jgi:hypothetical protein
MASDSIGIGGRCVRQDDNLSACRGLKNLPTLIRYPQSNPQTPRREKAEKFPGLFLFEFPQRTA